MSGFIELPQYLKFATPEQQERYQAQLNLALTQDFNSNGLLLPVLDNAQVATLAGLTNIVIIGRIWLNSDLDKLQFIDTSGTVQTVTST